MFTIVQKSDAETKEALSLLFNKTLNNKVVLFRSRNMVRELECTFMPVGEYSTRNIVVQQGPYFSLHKKSYKWMDEYWKDECTKQRTYIDGVNCDYNIESVIYFHIKKEPIIVVNFLNPVVFDLWDEIELNLPHLRVERYGQSAFDVRNVIEIRGFKKMQLPVDFIVTHDYNTITVEESNGLVQEVYDTMSLVDIYERLLIKYIDGEMEEKIKEYEHVEFNTQHCRCFEYDGKTDLRPYYLGCRYFRLYDNTVSLAKCGPMGRGHQKRGFFVPLSIINDPMVRVIEVMVPDRHKGSFIGSKGQNIKRLEKEIGKKIKLI